MRKAQEPKPSSESLHVPGTRSASRAWPGHHNNGQAAPKRPHVFSGLLQHIAPARPLIGMTVRFDRIDNARVIMISLRTVTTTRVLPNGRLSGSCASQHLRNKAKASCEDFDDDSRASKRPIVRLLRVATPAKQSQGKLRRL